MAFKVEKDIVGVMEDFSSYLKRGLADGADRFQILKKLVEEQQTDISKFNDEITYQPNVYTAAANQTQKHRISLLDLFNFHKTGRYNNLNIQTDRTDLDSLRELKMKLPVTYTTAAGNRPGGGDITQWNGGLVLDIDLRKALFNYKHIEHDDESIRVFVNLLPEFRKNLHEQLCRYHWYLWTTFSASLGGVHIRTKSNIETFDRIIEDFLNTTYGEQNKSEKERSYTLSDERFRLAYNMNAIYKAIVCYDAIFEAMRVFYEAYGLDRYSMQWLEEAIDLSGLRISQGMFVRYDPEITLNPNFKDVPLYFDFYDYTDLCQRSLMSSAFQLKRFYWNANPFSKKEQVARPRRELSAEEQRERSESVKFITEADVALFRRELEQVWEKRDEPSNSLYWQVASYLYHEYTGQNFDLTFDICKKLIDPQSKHHENGRIRAMIQSVQKQEYRIKGIVRTVMKQVLMGPLYASIARDSEAFTLKFNNENIYHLQAGEYVGKHIHTIADRIECGQSMILVSGTGTGKTEGVIELVLEKRVPTDSLYPQEEIQYIPNGKTMLIIEPFKSIVESKFNRWKEHVHLIYGTQNDDIRSNKSIFVAIIDKVQSSVELGPYNHPRFDYIVIDESHLLTMSEYRRNCGLLLDYLKNRTIQSKIIYMTGTPLFERQFLPENALCVQLKKPAQYPKTINIFTGLEHPGFYMEKAAAQEISQGRKVIIIVRQKKDASKIAERIGQTLGYSVKYGEFFQDTKNSQLSKDIIQHKSLGEVDIAFVTAIFSCGVDIEGEEHAVFYTCQPLNGIEIDQYASRLRHVPIEFNLYVEGHELERIEETCQPLQSFRKGPGEELDREMLSQLNDANVSRKEARMIIEAGRWPYFVEDTTAEGYVINDTLRELYGLYHAWNEWSRQWVVAAWYLRERGYQVNLNPWVEFVENSTPKDPKEENRKKTEKRNLKYDNFNRIIKTQAEDIAYLYANVLNTRFEIQRYAPEEQPEGGNLLKFGKQQTVPSKEGNHIDYEQTLYVEDRESWQAFIDNMFISNLCKLPFEVWSAGVYRVFLASSNKQLSVPKLEALSYRLWMQYAKDSYLLKIIQEIEKLNTQPGAKNLSQEEYDKFIYHLVEVCWERSIAGKEYIIESFSKVARVFVSYYYTIQRKEVGGFRISKRHDRVLEDEAARYRNAESRIPAQQGSIKLPAALVDFFNLTDRYAEEETIGYDESSSSDSRL